MALQDSVADVTSLIEPRRSVRTLLSVAYVSDKHQSMQIHHRGWAWSR